MPRTSETRSALVRRRREVTKLPQHSCHAPPWPPQVHGYLPSDSRSYAALYSGAIHPTAEAHAIVADHVLPHVRRHPRARACGAGEQCALNLIGVAAGAGTSRLAHKSLPGPIRSPDIAQKKAPSGYLAHHVPSARTSLLNAKNRLNRIA